ncbi:MAG: hypothetical protein SFW65_00620 [Alphaproteobacteria bacterium]|nr:hypothetical protein [Alphaproteobacteria bacterium]
MTAPVFSNEILLQWTIGDFIHSTYLAERPLIDLAHQKAKADLGLPPEPKGRYDVSMDVSDSSRFIRSSLILDISEAKYQGAKLIHAHLQQEGFIPQALAFESSESAKGFIDMPIGDIIKLARQTVPDAIPLDYKKYVAWFHGETSKAADGLISAAQNLIVDRTAAYNVSEIADVQAKNAADYPALVELRAEYRLAEWDTYFNRELNRIINETEKQAKAHHLHLDEQGLLNHLLTPQFYKSFLENYKRPTLQDLTFSKAWEDIKSGVVTQALDQFAHASHPDLALTHHTYPESKRDTGYHVFTALLRNRVISAARQQGIKIDRQLMDGELFSRTSYRDYRVMSLMNPAEGYQFDDAKGFSQKLEQAIQAGIIDASQASQLEKLRARDFELSLPGGTWNEYKSAVVDGIVKKLGSAVPEARSSRGTRPTGAYAYIAPVVAAARGAFAWMTGASNDTRPNP